MRTAPRPSTVLPLVLAAILAACGDKDDACDDGARACDGDVLEECVDGVWEETDCAEDGMICHDLDDESHCMMDGEMDM